MTQPDSPRPLCMAFVMDPIEAIDIDGDTTFVFMLEAQARGHEVLYVDPGDLSVSNGRVLARATPVRLQREAGNHAVLGAPRTVDFDAEVDVAWQRVDPPVDTEYSTATQILGICARTLVLNRPKSVLAYNEKIFALHFADLMPPTLVTRDQRELGAWMEKLGGEMIVKPLDGKGGEGIFLVSSGDRNRVSILEQSTRFGTRRVMAQAYLPEVRTGDKRILLLEGEPLGAVLRVPADDETRANLHVGGRAERAPLSEADRRIIERIAPELKDTGLFFVGIDVIGERLTEINVTSPTGVQEINALEETRLEEQVIERAEIRARERAASA